MVRRERSVDLPEFGSPIRPISARCLRESLSIFFCPGRPGCAIRGVLLVEVAKC